MRRFGWQIGGVSFALALIVGLGLLAFGCGSSATPALRGTPTASARPTATADARAAMVKAAARRYVDALGNALKTGSPSELDALTVPGSQAEGNAGASAHIVRGTGRCFVVMQTDITSVSVNVVGATDAVASVSYTFTGYDAQWPSLKQLTTSRSLHGQHTLEFELVGSAWLVATEQ